MLAYPKLPDVELGRREQFLLLDEGFEDETLILDTIVKWDVNDAFDITCTTAYVSPTSWPAA